MKYPESLVNICSIESSKLWAIIFSIYSHYRNVFQLYKKKFDFTYVSYRTIINKVVSTIKPIKYALYTQVS